MVRRTGIQTLLAAVGISGLLIFAISGCAVHKQVQYFGATDPETGLTNYYKMTVTGSGGFPMDYHLQAGYFSSAAVDILRGSMPKIPTLDMPIEHEEHFRQLTDRYYESLIDAADAVSPPGTRRKHELAEALLRRSEERLQAANLRKQQLDAEIAAIATPTPEAEKDRLNQLRVDRELLGAEIPRLEKSVTEAQELVDLYWTRVKEELTTAGTVEVTSKSPQELEDQVKQLARLVWFGSLSEADVMSVGMTESTDPYQFRKLVFWASASNIDLNQFSTEIDAVVDNVTQIAGSYRQQAKQRAAARGVRQQAISKLLGMLKLPQDQKDALLGLFGLFSPAAPAPATSPIPGEGP